MHLLIRPLLYVVSLIAVVTPAVSPAATGDVYAEVMASPASVSWWTPGHAFICISYHLNSGIKEECYGFYRSNLPNEAFVGAPGLANEFKKNPMRFTQVSWSMKNRISDQQRKDFFNLVDSVNTKNYKLLTHNCGDFVSDAVTLFGWRNVAKGASPEPYVRELYTANIKRFNHSSGSFRRSNSNWQEFNASGAAVFSFIETGHDSAYISIRDASRNLDLRLPIRGGMSQWRTTGGWSNLYKVSASVD